VEDDRIVAELVERAEREPERGLLQFRSWPSARQYRDLYRIVRAHVRPGTAVLDWGAGNGHFSYFLTRAGYRATGFSFIPLERGGFIHDGEYRFVQGDPDDPVTLPFPDASFDAVASIGVLEHVRETGGSEARSLAEIGRVLRPGGVFICYHFPNRYSWIDLLAKRFPGKHHHPYRFTRRDIETLVAGAGLTLLHARRYGALPRNGWHRAPRALRRSRVVAGLWDALDDALRVPLSAVCQNYIFVAARPQA
jgi:SAM-dependent methyltransferase